FKMTPMIGRSHGIHAEPITFGLKFALMFDEFGRAEERLTQTRERIRIGKLSGAVGTHAHLDSKIESAVCEKLGLKPATLSTQIVQRDRHAEFMATLAVTASSVDRWATEFRHLQRTEVLEVEEFFSESILLALTRAGAERKNAYEAVQRAAMKTWKGGGTFAENVKREPEIVTKLSAAEIDHLCSLDIHFQHVDATFKALGLD